MTAELEVTISLDAEVVEDLRRAMRECPNDPRRATDYDLDDSIVNAVAHALAEQHPGPPTYKPGDLIDVRANGRRWLHGGRTVLGVGDDWITWHEASDPVALRLPTRDIRPHVEGTV